MYASKYMLNESELLQYTYLTTVDYRFYVSQ